MDGPVQSRDKDHNAEMRREAGLEAFFRHTPTACPELAEGLACDDLARLLC